VDIAEETSEVQSFVEAQGLTFTILLDQGSIAARDFLVRGIPSSFFIDRNGVIQVRHSGPLEEAVINQYVELLLR
jgi:peroxiredoxin